MNTIPTLDLQPTQHLPYAVEQARPHPDTAPTACPDGIAFCDGRPGDHDIPGHHLHMGRIKAMHGPYDDSGDGLMAYHLRQIDGEKPVIEFAADGTWPELDVAGMDGLIHDATTHLVNLIADRRRLACLLDPCRTPLDEPEDKQTSSAAFSLALKAMDVALDKTDDRAGMLLALRTWLQMTEDEA